MQKYTPVERVIRVLMFIFLAIFTVLMIYPFWYVLIYALSDSSAAISGKVLLWPLEPTFAVFQSLFGLKQLWVSYLNTIIVTGVGTLLAIVFTTTLAYPLSISRLYGRKFVSMMIFFTMLFNGGMIPNYLLIKELGLLNSRWSLIWPGILSANNVLIMRSFFKAIPKELEESASIDGASPLRILLRIILPVSLPAIAVQAMFYGVNFWNSYFDSVLYIDKTELMSLQAYLRTLIQSASADAANVVDTASNSALSSETTRMGCVAVSVIPILIVYPMLQKYYVKGLVVGSVKG